MTSDLRGLRTRRALISQIPEFSNPKYQLLYASLIDGLAVLESHLMTLRHRGI